MSSKNPSHTRISSESAVRRPMKLLGDMLNDLKNGRELAWQLALREIRALHRQAAFGYLWIFVMPVSIAAVWLFMHRAGVVAVPGSHLSYASFVISGTIVWSIFADAVNAPLQQVSAARQMLARVNFPREALVISGLYQVAFNAVIRIVVLVAALTYMGVTFDMPFMALPLAVAMIILAGTVIGVALTPFGLLYADVGKSLPLIMQFLMLLNPVVYPTPRTGLAARLMEWNPIAPLVEVARASVLSQPLVSLSDALAVSLGFLALLIAAWVIYRLSMPFIVERAGA